MNKKHPAVVIPAHRQGRDDLEPIVDKTADYTGLSRTAMIRLLDSPTPGVLEKLFFRC